MYRLCSDYCKYFLGAYLNYADLSVSSENSYHHYDLRDENCYIDYKPYLEALGIIDLENISEQYSCKGR